LNGAYHFKQRIDSLLALNDRRGIAFDILAELILLAFAMEAQINLKLLVPKWNEREGFDDKRKRLFRHLQLKPNMQKRPYSVIKKLKQLRDSMAHGKPQFVEIDEIKEIDQEDDPVPNIKPEWVVQCNESFAREAYEDVRRIWEEMLEKSKLVRFFTVSGGSASIKFIEKLAD
jgi:hypothetical protein